MLTIFVVKYWLNYWKKSYTFCGAILHWTIMNNSFRNHKKRLVELFRLKNIWKIKCNENLWRSRFGFPYFWSVLYHLTYLCCFGSLLVVICHFFYFSESDFSSFFFFFQLLIQLFFVLIHFVAQSGKASQSMDIIQLEAILLNSSAAYVHVSFWGNRISEQ